MTQDQLNQISKNAAKFPLLEVMDRYQINTPLRQAHFLAQVMHESGDFRTNSNGLVEENLNYTVVALLAMFGRHRISQEDAEKYGRTPTQKANQEAIANIIYGGEWGKKNLGNTNPGDGWLYRGRGLIQVTGKTNVANFSARFYGDTRLVSNPNPIAEPYLAAMSAGSFWDQRGLNKLADQDDVKAIRRAVNGGVIGLADVQAKLNKIKNILGVE